MQMPMSPPDLMATLKNTRPDRVHRVYQDTGMLVDGKYLPWDNLRHREPPEGLSHEEWWLGLRMSRMAAREKLPLVDKHGRRFSLVHAGPIRRGLHEIDQKLGMSGPWSDISELVDAHGPKHLLANSIMEEAIRSSQLEGASTTRAVAKEMIRERRRPRTGHERMILNNYSAMSRIGDLARRDLGSADIFELHRILVDGAMDDPAKAGAFRSDADKIVVKLTGLGETAHKPPSATELPERMDRLLAFANAETREDWLHPVIRAIVLHFMIGYDHPFVDGNGRVARSLFYWSMARQGYRLVRYLTVSRILREAPAKYSRAYLYTETDDGDLTYFIDYHIGVISRSIDALAGYATKKAAELKDIEVRLSGTCLNHRQVRLLRHALRHPGHRYTVQSHGTSHGIAANTARFDLTTLAEEGLLVLLKHGRRHEFLAPRDIEKLLADYARGEST